jgi:hypothetical protein
MQVRNIVEEYLKNKAKNNIIFYTSSKCYVKKKNRLAPVRSRVVLLWDVTDPACAKS